MSDLLNGVEQDFVKQVMEVEKESIRGAISVQVGDRASRFVCF